MADIGRGDASPRGHAAHPHRLFPRRMPRSGWTASLEQLPDPSHGAPFAVTWRTDPMDDQALPNTHPIQTPPTPVRRSEIAGRGRSEIAGGVGREARHSPLRPAVHPEPYGRSRSPDRQLLTLLDVSITAAAVWIWAVRTERRRGVARAVGSRARGTESQRNPVRLRPAHAAARCEDLETLRYFSGLYGRTEALKTSHSRGTGSSSTSTQPTETDLAPIHSLQQLEDFTAIAQYANQAPVTIKMRLTLRDPTGPLPPRRQGPRLPRPVTPMIGSAAGKPVAPRHRFQSSHGHRLKRHHRPCGETVCLRAG